MSVYPPLFSLIYSLTHPPPPRFLSPLPIQLSFSLSTPFLSYGQTTLHPFSLSPLPIQLSICLSIHTICWTNKKKRQQSLLTKCKWPYRDGGIWAWQGEAVDPSRCCNALDGEAKGGKEVFPEHAVNKVDYGQREHQVGNGCGQLSCHCEVVQRVSRFWEVCLIWNRCTGLSFIVTWTILMTDLCLINVGHFCRCTICW